MKEPSWHISRYLTPSFFFTVRSLSLVFFMCSSSFLTAATQHKQLTLLLLLPRSIFISSPLLLLRLLLPLQVLFLPPPPPSGTRQTKLTLARSGMVEKSKWQTDRFNTPNIHRIQRFIMRGPLPSPPAEYQTLRATAALESRLHNYLAPKEDYKTTISWRECKLKKTSWGPKGGTKEGRTVANKINQ